ncbi:MAG TPA: hypothetical protein VF928_09560 [Usitatibacteraceae bacterium]
MTALPNSWLRVKIIDTEDFDPEDFVIPAKAGIQSAVLFKSRTGLGPRWDDGGFRVTWDTGPF